MRTLIDSLLDFSRVSRRSSKFDRVDLNSVFTSVVSDLELKIEEAEADINLSGMLPVIEAVPSEIAQLFSNIISNALKFRKTEDPVRINVRSSKLGKAEQNEFGLPGNVPCYKIEVEDNGIGFEPEYSEKIFQIFQRLNGKSEYPGSGIGLAICKKIVEKHNGLIFGKSRLDQGATFTVILPEKQF
jgi:signal transduction histidine kinase